MIHLATLGFGDGLLKSLSIALANRGRGCCVLGDLDSAQMLLVDADQASERDWKPLMAERQLPILLLSSGVSALSIAQGDLVARLPKPLQFSELVTAIKGLVTDEPKLRSDTEENEPDLVERISRAKLDLETGAVERSAGVSRAGDSVQADRFLLGYFLKTLSTPAQRRFLLIQSGRREWLALDRVEHRVCLSMGRKALRSFALVPVEEQGLTQHYIDAEKFEAFRAISAACVCLEEFIWSLSVSTARRHRLDLLDVDKVYRLKYWPNFARYSATDMDIPMANYWVGCDSSPSELAERMHIGADKVYPFASCCLAAGLLEPVERTETVKPDVEQPSRLHKVLSMMLGKMSVREAAV